MNGERGTISGLGGVGDWGLGGGMGVSVSEKLLLVAGEIESRGQANLTRLTVLKKWFEQPGRLAEFGLWVARCSAENKGKANGTAAKLLVEARGLLGSSAKGGSGERSVERRAAAELWDRARAFQNEYWKVVGGR